MQDGAGHPDVVVFEVGGVAQPIAMMVVKFLEFYESKCEIVIRVCLV